MSDKKVWGHFGFQTEGKLVSVVLFMLLVADVRNASCCHAINDVLIVSFPRPTNAKELFSCHVIGSTSTTTQREV